MSAFNLSGSEDDRIGRAAPRPKPPAAPGAAPGAMPGATTGTGAAFHFLKNLAVLVLIAIGTFALCQLLLFSYNLQ